VLTPEELRRVCGGILDDLAVLFRSVAAVCNGPPGREPPRLRLLEGIAVVVDNLSQGKPVVAFLDDVHLADASSLEALDYMTRSLANARVLVLVAARQSELAQNPVAAEVLSKLEQDGDLRRRQLSPLGRDALGQLAEQVLQAGRPSEALINWLEQRSLGHPLFALGLLRALQEEGADLTAPQLHRLPEDLGERVAARMQFLDEPALSILELLAVHARRMELTR
jgi:predicted ATPase